MGNIGDVWYLVIVSSLSYRVIPTESQELLFVLCFCVHTIPYVCESHKSMLLLAILDVCSGRILSKAQVSRSLAQNNAH